MAAQEDMEDDDNNSSDSAMDAKRLPGSVVI
jgi:hypothetical protein